jgi:hypothetical protein
MSATKIMSVRVPLDVAEMIENTCKSRGITRNALLSECIASQGKLSVTKFAKGGQTQMPNELTEILSGIGGVGIGATVYHILDNELPREWDKDTRSLVSVVGAVAGGLLAVYGIQKLLEK